MHKRWLCFLIFKAHSFEALLSDAGESRFAFGLPFEQLCFGVSAQWMRDVDGWLCGALCFEACLAFLLRFDIQSVFFLFAVFAGHNWKFRPGLGLEVVELELPVEVGHVGAWRALSYGSEDFEIRKNKQNEIRMRLHTRKGMRAGRRRACFVGALVVALSIFVVVVSGLLFWVRVAFLGRGI
jgi:hypothetical protein